MFWTGITSLMLDYLMNMDMDLGLDVGIPDSLDGQWTQISNIQEGAQHSVSVRKWVRNNFLSLLKSKSQKVKKILG